MFFDELKLPFFKALDSSDSAPLEAVYSRILLGFRFFRFRSFFRVSNSSNSRLIPVAQNAPRFFVLSLFFLCFASGFSLVIRAQKPTFSRHSFVAVSLPLLSFGSRARCGVAPFFSVSNFPNSATDNQGTNAQICVFLSLLFLCFCLASLFRLCFVSLVIRARNDRFC